MLSAPDIALSDGLESFLQQDLNKELLRFTTAGSVDDGKSTLIGRLLHDSKAVYEDQLAAVKNSRINRSGEPIDFSLLTDGLRAEREQGITIDVAYRYFSTSRRKFIIADTPGHEQYTRNMATGASTADLAVILIDATKGLLPQTRRHAYIASLLGIPSILAAVNKMDLADYREDVFLGLEKEFLALAEGLGVRFVQCIPISALEGDNVVARSKRTAWYAGPTLLEHLESVEILSTLKMDAVRFPIQYVVRPDATFRGFAGRVASGTLRPGDALLALPSRKKTRLQSIVAYGGELDEAIPSESVVLRLEDEIDLSRGDMLVSPGAPPHISNHFAAMVVWLHEKPLELNRTYLAKHAGRHVRAKAVRIRYRVDINTLAEQPADQLEMNGIAAVEFETSSPLFFDSYDDNRTIGSFILIDPISNATVGAAMIREALSQREVSRLHEVVALTKSGRTGVTPEERYQRHGHRSAVFSVTQSLDFAELLERSLFERGFQAVLVRHDKVPSAAVPALLSTLWVSGVVIVYWSETVRPEDRVALNDVAGDFLFEVSAGEPSFADQELLPQVLAIAESLRIGNDPAKETQKGGRK